MTALLLALLLQAGQHNLLVGAAADGDDGDEFDVDLI